MRRSSCLLLLLGLVRCVSTNTYGVGDFGASTWVVDPVNIVATQHTHVLLALRNSRGDAIAGLQASVLDPLCLEVPTQANMQSDGTADLSLSGCSLGQHTLKVALSMGSFSQVLSSVRYLNVYEPASDGTSVITGTPLNGDAVVRDAAGMVMANSPLALHLASTDPFSTLPAVPPLQEGSLGQVEMPLGLILRSPGHQTVTLLDALGNVMRTTGYDVAEPDGTPLQFEIGAPGSIVAGMPFALTVSVVDNSLRPVPTFTGAMTWNNSHPITQLLVPYTFQSTDAGTKIYAGIVINEAGFLSLSVQGSGVAPAVKIIYVAPGPAVLLKVLGDASAVTQTPASWTVQAEDVFGNVADASAVATHIGCSDAAAAYPTDVTLVAGIATITTVFANTGAQTITASQPGLIAGALWVAVTGAPSQLALNIPADATAGVALPVTVSALDANGALAPSAASRIVFASSDAGCILPHNAQLTQGSLTVANAVIFASAGAQTLGVADFAGVLGHRSANVLVVAGPASQCAVTDAINPAPLNQPATFKVTALDAYGNQAPTYNGTMSFASSDSNAQLPATLEFDSSHAGQQTVAPGVAFSRVGAVTLTANDPLQGLACSQNDIIVHQPVAIKAAQDGLTVCVLFDDHLLKCWGVNHAALNSIPGGTLGLGDPFDRGSGPNEMGALLPYVQLGTGRSVQNLGGANRIAMCAILDNGQLKCWGDNTFGELGQGDTQLRGSGPGQMGDALPAVALGTGRTALTVSTGGRATSYGWNCAILDNGQLKCWGDNSQGELGMGDTNNRGATAASMGDALPAVALGTGRTATMLSAGGVHTCAILDTQQVKCWGTSYGYQGVLGLGDLHPRGANPNDMGDNLPTVALGSGRSAVSLCTGTFHTCVILDNHQLKCWGDNVSQQLGLGDSVARGGNPNNMGDQLPQVNLGNQRVAQQIACGTFHTCAVLDDGTTKCWGGNAAGQLGLGDTLSRGGDPNTMADNLPAVQLGAGRTAAYVATAGYVTCVLTDNGRGKCWGGVSPNGTLAETATLGLGDTVARGAGPAQMGDNLPYVLW